MEEPSNQEDLPNKNLKFNDRISALPDSLIQQILTFLPLTKDVVKTSVLSRRWKYLWTCTPVLIFHYRLDFSPEFYEHYCEFIDRCVTLYSSSQIKKFLLQLDYPHYCIMNPRIESWLLFTMNHEVEELSLEFCVLEDYAVIPSYSEAYSLPQFFYRISSLVKLKTQFCEFVPEEKVAWRSLKILYIGHANFSDEVMKNILSGSPSLESLELNSCYGIQRLDITFKSLKRLVIYHVLDLTGEDHSCIEIFGPHLEDLRILGSLGKRKCNLITVSCLISVVLDFQLSVPHGDVNEYQTLVRSLLEKVQHAKKLKIGTWCVEVLSLMELKRVPSPLSTRKCLVLNFRYFNKLALPGIRSLLQSSPELEKLVIKLSSGISLSLQFYFDHNFANNYDVEENFWASGDQINYSCFLLNLKNVEIFSIEEYLLRDKHAVEFVEFLLKNGRILEKMVISEAYPFHVPNKTDHLLKLAQKLLSFPRSSPHAVVLFPINK